MEKVIAGLAALTIAEVLRRVIAGAVTLAIAGLLLIVVPSNVDACQKKEYTPVEQSQSSPEAEQTGRPAPSQGNAPSLSASDALPDPSGGSQRPGGEAVDTQAGTLRGVASTYGPGFGGRTAVPVRTWLGRRVAISYGGRCVIRTVTDYGPDPRVFPGRVADLDQATFEALCGCGWRRGLLYDVTVELISERD